MEKIRIFIAIELMQEIKENLRGIQEELKKANADVKWVKPENIHLTLKFMGSVPAQQIPEIAGELKSGLVRMDPLGTGFGFFSVEIAKVGSFPEKGKPRVIWAGVESGSEDVIRLQGKVEDSLKKFNFPGEDREYTPHLTVGRVKGPENIKVLQELLGVKSSVQFGRMLVEDVSIIRSDLKPDGPVYTTLEKILLEVQNGSKKVCK
ncbi:RNA 2',3'-cyclic phosphodiesterase [Candidatus Desantisbacteria bacterium CG07_land_8_20_14_0_80_39_15]|uniref:RNA 2',3'-cyclic phosphodiesterase n=2 Tax=unclassified Candidatus Desantisiibacteriota TaxID=3106372 RepID=A0A2M6ZED8_9BACT|nr:MAG: RNA 2',3'-cyclic phosphodiesterase [Candidatus Desantisbacteria bacterium CG07_land_8_20_14_0_80_39_15]